MKSEEENFESIVGGKHQKIKSIFHSHRKSRFKNLTILGIASEVERPSRRYMKSKIEEVED
jgi:hypothetical protein